MMLSNFTSCGRLGNVEETSHPKEKICRIAEIILFRKDLRIEGNEILHKIELIFSPGDVMGRSIKSRSALQERFKSADSMLEPEISQKHSAFG